GESTGTQGGGAGVRGRHSFGLPVGSVHYAYRLDDLPLPDRNKYWRITIYRPGTALTWITTGTNPEKEAIRVANVSQRTPDIAQHPDMAEMRARYARILDGGQAVAVDGLVLLTGLYLAVSPWVVGFAGSAPRMAVNDLILGLAVAAIGLGLAIAPLVMY